MKTYTQYPGEVGVNMKETDIFKEESSRNL